ncbi:DHHC-type zinc finger family protein [Trypanosoma theileri]|uniref:Palmitoyltransferase n=1 Tax=Trypanosoma theileri TaxID=67003 RepID=A0A1X0P5Q8_9TRYP|nr:DHHC-type zinc finger family protein [Trypanosoma theileri]ORC92215.1 DHHC-type zinc finger family protein [Trypanosoma theileri]
MQNAIPLTTGSTFPQREQYGQDRVTCANVNVNPNSNMEFYQVFEGSMARAPPIRWSNAPKRVLGRSHLICCCILPRDGANSICIVVFLLLIDLIFMIGVVPRGEFYSYLIVSILSIAALICLILSVTVDPGILLPLPPDPGRQPQITMINGKEVLCKICPTCHIVRPPRSTHCQFCDYCVEVFDHHCGVIGCCVAKRTFRFFGGFFIFTSILAIFILIRSAVALADTPRDTDTASGRWTIAATTVSLVVAGFAGCIVVPMAVYYVYLGCMNSTQKESARFGLGLFEPNRDFHEGFFRNFWRRYFGSLGKSRITAENANIRV